METGLPILETFLAVVAAAVAVLTFVFSLYKWPRLKRRRQYEILNSLVESNVIEGDDNLLLEAAFFSHYGKYALAKEIKFLLKHNFSLKEIDRFYRCKRRIHWSEPDERLGFKPPPRWLPFLTLKKKWHRIIRIFIYFVIAAILTGLAFFIADYGQAFDISENTDWRVFAVFAMLVALSAFPSSWAGELLGASRIVEKAKSVSEDGEASKPGASESEERSKVVTPYRAAKAVLVVILALLVRMISRD